MLFNSGPFFLFFAIVYILYCVLPHKKQNYLLLAASYFFYGYWDWRFLSLILISTVVDYSAGIVIHQTKTAGKARVAKYWLLLSIVVNLGILCFFKYYNFFAENLSEIMNGIFGLQLDSVTLDIILPVGISFYTFQTMSYTIDVYRRGKKPVTNFPDFALFVSFFPQLMAGPIERSKKLVPQIQKKRLITVTSLQEGGWLLFWGLFKKVFIADNLMPFVQWGIMQHGATTGLDVYLSLLAFTVVIYCDFSGYSDMARGMAAMMGFKLSRNFNVPYFSSSPSELWSRWHITMSNWFRDYVYAPLRELGTKNIAKYTTPFMTMALVGLWHGANWTFVVWGCYWGVIIIMHRTLQPQLSKVKSWPRCSRYSVQIMGLLLTFNLWALSGTLFIGESLKHAWSMMMLILTDFNASATSFMDFKTLLFYSSLLVVVQVIQFISEKEHIVFMMPAWARVGIYLVMLSLLVANGAEHEQEFIYFQF